ncbi:MAG TPA: universal stress protein [Chthoniobacterales bacterium]
MNPQRQRPIVCGTDFSEAAAQAANVAAALAIRLDAPLMLVHGVDERGEIPALYWPSLMDASRPQLIEEAVRLRGLGARVEEAVAGGVPDDGVACRAEQVDARFILLAASGHGALVRWMLGGVSERIAESAWVPTLVLRGATRIEEWVRGGQPLRVFVSADFTANSDAAMSWATELRQIGLCEFTVGYVDRFAEERGEQAMHAPPDTPRAPEMQEMLMHDLRLRAASYFPEQTTHIRVLPASGRVDSHLLELADEASADLIVVGTHQWHGLSRLKHPSVSRRILHAARVSVACVPAHRRAFTAGAPSSNVRRVLVATDLSPRGSRVIPQAFSMLQSGDAVFLLHVVKSWEPPEPQLERLRALIPSDAAEQGFQVNVEVVASHDVAGAICEAAERLDASLICVGSHGPFSNPVTAVGSTSVGVTARSKRPVLVVPHQAS